MAILVTGGARYIGSVTVERLTAKGERVVVLDDLVYGHRESIDADILFYQGSVGDQELLARITKEHKIESCVHFAALAYVGESVENPALYFENNVQQGIFSHRCSHGRRRASIYLFIFVHCVRGAGEIADRRRLSAVAEKSLWLDEVHFGTSSRNL